MAYVNLWSMATAKKKQNGIKSELLTKYYADECQPQGLDVKPERTVFKIIQVIVETTEHFLHSIGIAVIQSCITRYPRTYLIKE